MAAWIKMPLGMEVGLSPGDFVSDGDPTLPLNFRLKFIIVMAISLELFCLLVIQNGRNWTVFWTVLVL